VIARLWGRRVSALPVQRWPSAADCPASDEARRVGEQYERLETSWYTETLPMIVASFKLAVEEYDTFGPGMTRVEDATEAVS
jgi:hypothetical protein